MQKIQCLAEQSRAEQHNGGIRFVGNINDGGHRDNPNQGRVYDAKGFAPALTCMGGGGLQPHIVDVKKVDYVTMKQTVKVRKHEIDCMKLCDLLRKAKSEKKLNNKQIAKILCVEKTLVEHWFRRDDSFSIPDADIWYQLKELLGIKTDKYDIAITDFEERDGVYEKAERIYLPQSISPTLKVASADEKIIEVEKMEEIIVAMRGRDKDNPNFRGPSNENFEQVLEPNTTGCTNTITSVQKDNLVLETVSADALRMVRTEEGKRIRKDYENGSITHGFNEYREAEPRKDEVSNTLSTVPKDNEILETKKIKIRQATKDGFVDCEIPGIADLNYPDSQTRRGRVVRGGQISPTLTTENIPSLIELGNPDFYNFLYEVNGDVYLIRIRKLIPRECLRLMDVDEDVIDRMEKVESNVNLYKAAGNSIVTNVLTAVFGAMYSDDDVRQKYIERALI